MNQPVLPQILWARALRAFADGYVSLLLPIYLILLGMSPFQVGVIATGTLLGSGILTLLVGLHAWRFRYRTLLLLAAGLMAATGLGFATVTQFWPLLLIAVVGTINPSSGDASVFHPLEHALLSKSVDNRKRTAVFARYSLVGALVAALGSLAAGLPNILNDSFALNQRVAMQYMFLLYAVLGIASAVIYSTLPANRATAKPVAHAPLKKSKKKIGRASCRERV